MRELKEDTTPQEFVDASMFTAAAAATEADIASTLQRLLYDMKMVSERQDDLQVRLSSWPLPVFSPGPAHAGILRRGRPYLPITNRSWWICRATPYGAALPPPVRLAAVFHLLDGGSCCRTPVKDNSSKVGHHLPDHSLAL